MLDRSRESIPRGRTSLPPPLPEARPKTNPRSRKMRSGHRREMDPRRDRRTFQDRCDRALLDAGLYRAVSFQDLADAHFDGHPYTARRAVNQWIRAGEMREHTVHGPKGNPYKLLTPTRDGADRAREQAIEQGLDPHQRTWAGLVKHAELSHDAEVYRAARAEIDRLRAEGASVRRIRIDAELKSIVAKRSESARARDGKAAADMERIQSAKEIGLPVDHSGKVHFPDAQIEYTDAEGRTDHVNVEVATRDYRNQAIQAKAAAGFVIHGNGRAGARVSKALGRSGSKGIRGLGRKGDPPAGGTRGPADRGDASVDL